MINMDDRTYPLLRMLVRRNVMKHRFLAVMALFLSLFVACGRDDASLSPGGAVSSEYWFRSLPRMVATSDIVVLGTVAEVKQGITEGTPPDDIQLNRADLNVEEVLFGPVDVPSILTVETLQFVSPEPDWRKPGNTVLAFIKLSTEPDTPGIYYPINEQSVYLVMGTDVQATTADDSFSEGVAAMTLDEIRNRIEQAKQAIAAGELTPQEPVGG
jgi:hypothetical protein